MALLPEDGLPPELDFKKDPDASPDRMNRASAYLVALFRPLFAQKLEYEAAVDQLNAIGLERISIALAPVLERAQQQSDTIQAFYDQLIAGSALTELHEQLTVEIASAARAASEALTAAVETINQARQQAIAAAMTEAADEAWFLNHG